MGSEYNPEFMVVTLLSDQAFLSLNGMKKSTEYILNLYLLYMYQDYIDKINMDRLKCGISNGVTLN